MVTIDKQVTIRLEARDDLTPTLVRAAGEARKLEASLTKAQMSAGRMGAGRAAGLSGMAADMGRVETRAVSAGTAMARFNTAVASGTGRASAGMRGLAGDANRMSTGLVAAGTRGGAALSGLATQADRAAKSSRAAASGFEAITPAMLAIGLGVGAAARSFMEFDKNMAAVKANTGATGAELEALRSKAIELGGATQYSGAEAAAGLNELAKAGVSTQAIMGGGLQGALSLAASGQMEVAAAAEAAASAMNQFGLSGAQVPHIADVLAAGAATAQGSVKDMSDALNQTGVVAKQTGLSLEETVGGLTAFAATGRVGSDAGTSFKTMLQRLVPTSVEAGKAMQALGISAYDSQGNFIGLAEFAGNLQQAMKGLSDEQKATALTTIFGADAIQGANVLIEQGAGGIRKYTDQVNQAGFANQQAADLTNHLGGDIERLSGAIDSLVLKSGGGLSGFLRGAVQGLTSMVEAADAIPTPIYQTVAALVAMRTAGKLLPDLGPQFAQWRASAAAFRVEMAAQRTGMAGMSQAASTLGMSVQQIAAVSSASTSRVGGLTAAFRAAGGGLGIFRTAASGLLGVLGGPWGVALAAATAALSYFGAKSAEAKARQQELQASVESVASVVAEAGGQWTDAASKQLVQIAQQKNLIANYKNMGYSVEQVTTALTRQGPVRDSIIGQLDAAIDRVRTENTVMTENGPIVTARGRELADYYQQQKQGLLDVAQAGSEAAARGRDTADSNAVLAAASGKAAEEVDGLAGSQSAQALAAQDAKKANGSFIESLTGIANVILGQRDSVRAYESAIDAATEAVTKNGKSLDVHTQKGRDNQAALDAVASSGLKAAAEIFRSSGSIEKAANQVDATRAAFITTATRMGMTSKAAGQLADQLGLTRGDVQRLAASLTGMQGTYRAQVQVTGIGAALSGMQQLMQYGARLDGQTFRATAQVASRFINPFGLADGGVIESYANGGVRRERHVAQIARAGAWRVWAEDETGGEAYIPLHPAKRARSVSILEEVARRFGLAVSKQASGSILSFASGGTTTPVRGGTSGDIARITSSRLPVLQVAAQVTKITVAAGVKAPMLYTPGGPWDRSKPLPEANLSAITEAFKRVFVTAAMVAEAKARVAQEQQQYTASLAKVTVPKSTTAAARTTSGPSAPGGLSSASRSMAATAATAQGRAAGQAVLATQARQLAVMKKTVKAGTSPTDARAATLLNALSMNGRGSYKWGGGHTADYYKNSAALAADCSGFVGWAIGHAIGRNVTSTSGNMLKGNARLGYVKIDPQIAAKTAGAIMGRKGHVVMSLGDGRVIESYKTGKPVRIRKIAQRDYAMAAWNTALGPMTQATVGQITGNAKGAGSAGLIKDQTQLVEAQAEYARLLSASKIPAWVTLQQQTSAVTKGTMQFLQNIRKIRDRGFPSLAARLLAMGDEDGAAAAASLAVAPDKALRQQRDLFDRSANYEQLRADLTESLGKTVGPPAWVTATRETQASNAKWKTFLDNISVIAGKGFGTLAAKLLEMGVDEAGDIAAQAVKLSAKDLRNMRDALTGPTSLAARQEQMSKTILGPQWAQLTRSNQAAAKTSAAFLANIRKIRDRGFSGLALKLMEMGEEQAGDIAAEAAKATDKDLRNFRDSFTGLDSIQAEADKLLESLKGIGQILHVTPGLSTNSDPTIAYSAPRPVDARPSPVQYLTGPKGAGSAGPLMMVENIYTTSPRQAVVEMTTQLGDAVAVTGIGRL